MLKALVWNEISCKNEDPNIGGRNNSKSCVDFKTRRFIGAGEEEILSPDA